MTAGGLRVGARVSRRQVLRGGLVAAAGTLGGLAVGATGAAAEHAADAGDAGDPLLGPTFVDRRLREVRVVWKAVTAEKLVALTFDDGPAPDYTEAVLDQLKRLHVRATFNVVGQRGLAHRDLLRREVDEGHELGNHTWSHADLARADGAAVRRQLHRSHEAIARLAGTEPTILRPPYGRVSGDVVVAAGELGYDVIAWTVKFHEDLYDARGNADYIAANLAPGAVILAHDTGNRSRRQDVEALPRLVARADDAGFRFVTISELLSRGDRTEVGSSSVAPAEARMGPAAEREEVRT